MKSAKARTVVDPVCGMEISPDEHLSYTYRGTKYYFCSSDDMEKFRKNPDKSAAHEVEHR
jgi:YHS domain-containing protein